MSKTLLYRIFGAGKIPKDVLSQIRKEGVVLREEGIGGSITFRNFRSPGRRSAWRRSWFSGSIVLTRENFLAFAYSRQVIGIGWLDDEIRQLSCSVEDAAVLCVGFDASKFNDDWTGDVEVRFRTPLAGRFLAEISQRAA